jgi:hypothetical protein
MAALEAREAELKALDQEIAERESRLPPGKPRKAFDPTDIKRAVIAKPSIKSEEIAAMSRGRRMAKHSIFIAEPAPATILKHFPPNAQTVERETLLQRNRAQPATNVPEKIQEWPSAVS